MQFRGGLCNGVCDEAAAASYLRTANVASPICHICPPHPPYDDDDDDDDDNDNDNGDDDDRITLHHFNVQTRHC